MMGNVSVSDYDVLFLSIVILVAFFLLFAYFIVAYYWRPGERQCLSPYSGKPMRRGSDVPLSSVEVIMRYLYYAEHSYANRVFAMRRSMVCRETGRIFPNCVSPLLGSRVDWTFLVQQHAGNWVSWGSLTQLQQDEVRGHHDAIEGYQTAFSSTFPSPRAVEEEYAMAKPGPLYIDLDTYTLMGWKCVPDSEFEVLVVQKPRQLLRLSFEEKQKD